MKTITELEAILVEERKTAHKNGIFGLDECKKSIRDKLKNSKKSLQDIYVELIERGLTEHCFNTYMIVACEQMLEETKEMQIHEK